jgi:hypothetical protein
MADGAPLAIAASIIAIAKAMLRPYVIDLPRVAFPTGADNLHDRRCSTNARVSFPNTHQGEQRQTSGI